MNGLGQAQQSATGFRAMQNDCDKTNTAQENSLISTLRRKLFQKRNEHAKQAEDVAQAIEDLNDPIVQKVLKIMHLAG